MSIKMTNISNRSVGSYKVWRDVTGSLYFPLDEEVDPWRWFVVFPDGSMGLHELEEEDRLTPVKVLEIIYEDVPVNEQN